MVDTTDSKSVVARRKSSSLFSGIQSFPIKESFFVLTPLSVFSQLNSARALPSPLPGFR